MAGGSPMKSIRRTLLLNVLVLLVATLGVVTYVVYYTTVEALREKQRAARELVEVRYSDQRDEELRNRADNLARDVQQNFSVEKWWLRWAGAEVNAILSPVGRSNPLTTDIALFHTFPGPITAWQNNRFATELTLQEDEIYRDGPDASGRELIQMATDWGASWSSRSAAGVGLPADLGTPRHAPVSVPRFDTVTAPDGREFRRVIVKHPVTHYRQTGEWFRWPRGGPPGRLGGGGPGRPGGGGAPKTTPKAEQPRGEPQPKPPTDRALPTFYLVCSWEDGADHPLIADKIRKRDEQLERIDSETERSVGGLRATLAWTLAGAVAATLLGGWVLVGLGLFPLQRLSHAVSEINPKDFRLPIDPTSLPAEVNPVAARLSYALTQLHDAFEREKRAAADISHELRTPLAALTTTLEVACRKPRTADQYRQALDECRAIARQMSQLVERMLELAWLDAGAAEVRPEHVEIGDLVGGVAAIARPLAEAQGITLKLHVAPKLTVRTDPAKLREVVMNLTHNAIEYNRPGGEVELSAAAGAGGGVVVEVRDTGIGMPPGVQEKIFERFYRADASRQATGVHAGLGLAIVKEYVDRLGGRLTVDSAVGRGSRFRVELPDAL
jgi:signal transduction histidine kinase